jgi:DNA-binding CsgD family transcriptional regulator
MDALQTSEKNHLESLHELICSLEQVDFKLTHKEELICLLLCKGYTLTEISSELSCSVHTVNKQVGHLKNKAKIKSLHALIAWYLLKNTKKVA